MKLILLIAVLLTPSGATAGTPEPSVVEHEHEKAAAEPQEPTPAETTSATSERQGMMMGLDSTLLKSLDPEYPVSDVLTPTPMLEPLHLDPVIRTNDALATAEQFAEDLHSLTEMLRREGVVAGYGGTRQVMGQPTN